VGAELEQKHRGQGEGPLVHKHVSRSRSVRGGAELVQKHRGQGEAQLVHKHVSRSRSVRGGGRAGTQTCVKVKVNWYTNTVVKVKFHEGQDRPATQTHVSRSMSFKNTILFYLDA